MHSRRHQVSRLVWQPPALVRLEASGSKLEIGQVHQACAEDQGRHIGLWSRAGEGGIEGLWETASTAEDNRAPLVLGLVRIVSEVIGAICDGQGTRRVR